MLVQITKTKCDRCGSVSSEHDHPHVRQAWERFTMSESSPVRDLCPHCVVSLGEWFKAVAPKTQESVHDGN